MRVRCTLMVLSVLVAAAAGATQKVQYHLGSVDGVARTYYVFVPDNYATVSATRPFSVLFYLHAYGEGCGSGSNFLSKLAQAEALMVMPCGLVLNCQARIQESLGLDFTCQSPTQGGGLSRWNAGDLCCQKPYNDDQWVAQVVADVQTKYKVNPNKIYVTGFSNGGMMTEAMMCLHADLFQGAAIFSGALMLDANKPNNYAKCDAAFKPRNGAKFLKVHGDQDNVVPYNGGTYFVSAGEDAMHWAQRSKCTYPGTQVNNITGGVTMTNYPSCANNVVFQYVIVKGAGHGTWAYEDYMLKLFELPASSTPTDPCAAINCGAHGRCSNGACTCTDGYTGATCNIPPATDPCAAINCGAHGRCSNSACVCTDGYTGATCNIAPADPCSAINCGAHGSCSNGACVCTDGYTGATCNIAPTPSSTCFASAKDAGSNAHWLAFNVQTTAGHTIKAVAVVKGATTTPLSGPNNWGGNLPAVFTASPSAETATPFTLKVTDTAGAVSSLAVNAFGGSYSTCQ